MAPAGLESTLYLALATQTTEPRGHQASTVFHGNMPNGQAFLKVFGQSKAHELKLQFTCKMWLKCD